MSRARPSLLRRASDTSLPVADNTPIVNVQRSAKRAVKHAVSAIMLTLTALLPLLPGAVRAFPFDYNGTRADVIEGVQTYSVTGPFATGYYPGPPSNACALAVSQWRLSYYFYAGVTDLGGVDVFTPTTPYYHNYYCDATNIGKNPVTIDHFNMSRGVVQCPATYSSVVANWW